MSSRSLVFSGRIGPSFSVLVLVIIGLVCLGMAPQAVAFLPSCSNPLLSHSYSKQPISTCTSTELSMGLRSFLSKKVRGNRDEPPKDDNNSSSAKKKAPVSSAAKQSKEVSKKSAAASTAQKTAQQQQKAAGVAAMNKVPKKVRMGTDPKTGEIDVASQLGPETVQERIQRIKRGEMSSAEKEAFLKSALSTGNTPATRLPLTSGSNGKSASASPFPTDSILRNMAMGTKAGGSDKGEEPATTPAMDSQSKKRQYLDMVTDPTRFKTYSTGGAKAVDHEEDDEKDSLPVVPNIPKDLGARLGVAAMEDEKRNKELRQQREEQEKEVERQRQERERRLAEATRQRQEELAKREVEIMKRKKALETDSKRKLERKKQEEDARRAEMMKAQDDYWTRKLASERNGGANKNKKQQEEEEAAAAAAQAVVEEEEEDEEEAEEEVVVEAVEDSPDVVEIEDTPPEPATLESLNDVTSMQGRFSNNNMINRAASEVFGRPPLNDVVGRTPLNDVPSRNSILDDVARKKADREQQQSDQLERLRSMNSPLPASSSSKTNSARPRGPRKSNFQPQMPVTAARSQPPAQSLGDLTKTIQNAAGAAKKAETEKANDGSKSKSSFSNPFSRLTGGNKEKVEEAAPAAVSTPSPPPPAAVTPPPPKPAPAPRAPPPAPAPKRTGPIRMELPLGDDDEDDEEGAMTDGMTIGEIMKRQQSSGGADQSKRSKQWGVDMSRFQD